jgi:inner membrane protein
MANAKEHAVWGLGTGAVTYLLMCTHCKRTVNPGEALICGATGAFMAGVPDLIEPALNPHHRSFFHSVFFGGTLAAIAKAKCGTENQSWQELEKILFAVCVVAYISHLFLDGCTPMGLPAA